MLQEPFLQCRVVEEERLEAVILAINAEKMSAARISQVNPNVLIEKASMSYTRYGVTISDIGHKKTRMKTNQFIFIRVYLWLSSRQLRAVRVYPLTGRALSSVAGLRPELASWPELE